MKTLKIQPVFPSFILKHIITVLNLLPSYGKDSGFWILGGHFQEEVKDGPFAILSHVPLGTPNDVGGVCFLSEVILLVFHEQGNAGVGHDPNTGTAPHVLLEPAGGRVVHADHATDLVDLLSSTGVEHLTGAGDQGTAVTVNVQKLVGREDKKRKA